MGASTSKHSLKQIIHRFAIVIERDASHLVAFAYVTPADTGPKYLSKDLHHQVGVIIVAIS